MSVSYSHSSLGLQIFVIFNFFLFFLNHQDDPTGVYMIYDNGQANFWVDSVCLM